MRALVNVQALVLRKSIDVRHLQQLRVVVVHDTLIDCTMPVNANVVRVVVHNHLLLPSGDLPASVPVYIYSLESGH